MASFLIGSVTLMIGFLVAGLMLRWILLLRRFGVRLILASPLTLVLVILTLATFDQAAAMAGLGVAGLTERIMRTFQDFW